MKLYPWLDDEFLDEVPRGRSSRIWIITSLVCLAIIGFLGHDKIANKITIKELACDGNCFSSPFSSLIETPKRPTDAELKRMPIRYPKPKTCTVSDSGGKPQAAKCLKMPDSWNEERALGLYSGKLTEF